MRRSAAASIDRRLRWTLTLVVSLVSATEARAQASGTQIVIQPAVGYARVEGRQVGLKQVESGVVYGLEVRAGGTRFQAAATLRWQPFSVANPNPAWSEEFDALYLGAGPRWRTSSGVFFQGQIGMVRYRWAGESIYREQTEGIFGAVTVGWTGRLAALPLEVRLTTSGGGELNGKFGSGLRGVEIAVPFGARP